MGYGFIEFDSPASATDAIKRKQSAVIDGHALKLQLSNRKASGARPSASVSKITKGSVLPSPTLLVRNLAFESTRKELSQLFGSYGAITAVRMPKKSDYTGHR